MTGKTMNENLTFVLRHLTLICEIKTMYEQKTYFISLHVDVF